MKNKKQTKNGKKKQQESDIKKRVYEITENSPYIYSRANNIRFIELYKIHIIKN